MNVNVTHADQVVILCAVTLTLLAAFLRNSRPGTAAVMLALAVFAVFMVALGWVTAGSG